MPSALLTGAARRARVAAEAVAAPAFAGGVRARLAPDAVQRRDADASSAVAFWLLVLVLALRAVAEEGVEGFRFRFVVVRFRMFGWVDGGVEVAVPVAQIGRASCRERV